MYAPGVRLLVWAFASLQGDHDHRDINQRRNHEAAAQPRSNGKRDEIVGDLV
jgi:hypothetical protein